MKGFWYSTFSYLGYLLRSQSAHGLHSPFVFKLYTKAIRWRRTQYPEFPEVWRDKLQRNANEISLSGYGAGSVSNDSKLIKVSVHASNSLKKKYENELLFRLLNHLKPSSLLELGTSFGVSSLYLRGACPKAFITTIEGEASIYQIAKEQLEKYDIDTRLADLDAELENILSNTQYDCILFDANHTFEATLKYFQIAMKHITNDSFFIIDDIYWSQEMTKSWHEIKKHKDVTVSLDLFHFGVVFFRKEQQKEHFTLRPFQLIH